MNHRWLFSLSDINSLRVRHIHMRLFKQQLQAHQQYLPVYLLIVNGFLIALMLSLAKEVTTHGIPPITYAFWQTFIAGSILFLFSLKGKIQLNRHLFIYFVISGLSGIAVPNAIAFYLVTQIGAGFTGIMYALPPIFTFLITTSLGLEALNIKKLIGLCIAVMACSWIMLQRYSEAGDEGALWYALGMMIPLMLSIGNVYRSVAWPKGIKSMPLAAGTLLASALSLGVFASLNNNELVSAEFSLASQAMILMQGFLTALTYFCTFELLKRSDPVFTSQLGSVAAVFGLVIGSVWFKEVYSMQIYLGVLMVILGLRMSNKASIQKLPLLKKIEKQNHKSKELLIK